MTRHLRIRFALLVLLALASNHALADLDILVVGSTHTFSEGNESGVVQEKAFSPTAIAARLQNILANDPAISETVNVVSEDIYRNKTMDTAIGGSGSIWVYNYRCYSLMQYYMWPEGKTNRLDNLRGEAGTAWDYVVMMGDPYLMANMPGVFAEGIKLLGDEISSGTATPIVLAQWPETSSGFSAADFNEIAYRVGDSAGIDVVPAGKAWNSLTPKDSSSSHPTPDGAYLAASAIYSSIYQKNAKTSSYTYDNAIADHAWAVVQANDGVAQYTGTYTEENPFQMKYDQERVVDYCEHGTSTEEGFHDGLVDVYAACRVDYWRRNPPASGNPVDFSYSRGSDIFEADKQYKVDPAMYERTYGFPMGDHRNTGATTMIYGIDKRYGDTGWFGNGTDLGVAYSMICENEVPSATYDVRGIPVRLIWSKMNHYQPGLPSHRDSWHLSNELNRGVGSFMYTLVSGRCPIGPEPTDDTSTEWKYWFCRKLGYETAWRMSHLTVRVPGFQVFPSSATASNLTPTASETLAVNFAYAPTSDVTVAVATSDSLAGRVSPSTLTFTPQNYSNEQVVTVMGVTGSAGSHSFDITLTTTSDDDVFDGLSDTWDFCNTRAEGPPPSDIIVRGNGLTILTGDVTPYSADWTDFGIVTSSLSRTFTVENTSAGTTINFTGSPRADVTAGSGYFTITADIPVSSLAPSESTTFVATYTPAVGGTHTAVVSIASDDAAAPVYAFTVGGLRPSQPSVVFDGATVYGTVEATLSGQLSGGGSADAWLCWGENDAGTGSTLDWDNAVSIGTVAESVMFQADAEPLLFGIIYECRLYVTNISGEAWSAVTNIALWDVGSVESLNWDFETGDLQGWTNVGTTAGADTLFRNGNQPVSGTGMSGKQGTYYIDGYRANSGNSDAWTGIIETEDTFVIGPGAHLTMVSGGGTFSWSGTPDSPGTLAGVALEREVSPGTWENLILQTGGNNTLTARDHDLSAYEGETARLRIYDTTTGGWGWTGVDDITITAVAGVTAIVSNSLVQNVTNTSADVSGLLDAQNAVFDVFLFWSQVSNATPAAWESDGTAQSVLVGSYTNVRNDAIAKQLTSLSDGTTYYCTFMGTNEVTNIWAEGCLEFTTPGMGTTYTLTYLAGLNGSISGVATQTVQEGGSGSSVSAVPDMGYQFSNWSDTSIQNPRTDAGVTNDITVTAGFVSDPAEVSSDGATPSNTTSALLSGQLTAGGSANAWICWGDNDAGTGGTGNWDNVVSVGLVTEAGPFSVLVDTGATNATYWYRCYVDNDTGTNWSDATSFSGVPVGGSGPSEDAVVSISDVFCHNEKDNFTGNPGDMISGTGMNGNPHDYSGSWPTNDPSLWTATDSGYRSEWQSGGLLNPATSANSKIGWAIFELGSAYSLADFHIWNERENGGRYTATFNVYVAYTPTVAPTHGPTDASSIDYDFASGGWTKINGSILTGSWKGNQVVSLGGASARYVAVEILTNGGDATRAGLAEVGIVAAIQQGSPLGDLAPTAITSTGAVMNATLDASGTDYDVYVYYGTSDGVTNAGAWESTDSVGSYTNVSTNVSYTASLTAATTYYYTFMASNSTEMVWASPSWRFATLISPNPITANHSVPHAWLASVNPAWTNDFETAAMDDQDGDGFTTWQEYWSGTNPDDADSCLKIDAIVPDGTDVRLEWQHDRVDPGLPAVAIEACTNLALGLWEPVGQKIPVDGLNTWITLSGERAYYRLSVTNAP